MNGILRAEHRARIESWNAAGDYVAVGNLGEQVAARLLVGLGYQILATQDDLVGGVASILERPADENPEDFIAIDPDGRLMTVNSKASVSPRTSRLTTPGNLKAPRLRGQADTDYYSMRAGLLSPLDGAQTYGQVVKVDLFNLKAQIFEIEDDGALTPLGGPVEIGSVVDEILEVQPGRVRPPRLADLED